MSYFFEVGRDRLNGPLTTIYEDWLVSWGLETPADNLWRDLVTSYAASEWSVEDRWNSPFKAGDGTDTDRARGWAPSLYWENKFAQDVMVRRAMLSV